MKKYRCKICGHIVKTDKMDSIYKCPKCGAGLIFGNTEA